MYIGSLPIDILGMMCYHIVVMYITEIPTRTRSGKLSHLCILLRESYRQNGGVKNRTIANLTHCDAKEVAAIRLALKYKDDLTVLGAVKDVELEQGMSIGGVWLVYDVARQLGIEKALGQGRSGKLALWQVIARMIDQGSRLSAVRLAQVHVACDILGIREGFNEDHLYNNLAWLSRNQKGIEKRLFAGRGKGKKPELFLYDVSTCHRIPRPSDTLTKLLKEANVCLPGALPFLEANVVSRKTLKSHRRSN